MVPPTAVKELQQQVARLQQQLEECHCETPQTQQQQQIEERRQEGAGPTAVLLNNKDETEKDASRKLQQKEAAKIEADDGSHHQQQHPHYQNDNELQQCLEAPSKAGTHHHPQLPYDPNGEDSAAAREAVLWSDLMEWLEQNMPEDASEITMGTLLFQQQDDDETISIEERIQTVLNLMETHMDKHHVQHEGCWLLAKLAAADGALNTHHYQQLIANANGIAVVLRVMQTHTAAMDVQEQACAALRNLALYEPNEEKIAQAGGISVLIQTVMHRHQRASKLQEQGIGALRNLAGISKNKGLIASVGGLEVILQALENFGHVATVVEQACAALRNLAWMASNRRSVVASGGIPQVIRVMKQHPQHVGIQEHATAVLGILARQEDSRNLIAQSHGIDIILSNMEQFQSSAAVQTSACMALDMLGFHNAENQKAILDAGGMHLVWVALQQYGMDDSVLATVACSALTHALDHEEKEKWIASERTDDTGDMLRQLMAKHQDSMGVQHTCDTVQAWFA